MLSLNFQSSFGIGTETMSIAANSYSVCWFKDKELSFVFGLQMSVARAGSTVIFMTMAKIYDKFNEKYKGHKCLGMTLLFAALTCVASVIASLVLGYLDKRAQQILHKKTQKSEEQVNISDIKDFCLSFWLISFVIVTFFNAIFPFTAIGR